MIEKLRRYFSRIMGNKSDYPNGLLDSRNRSLYKQLQQTHDFTFADSIEDNYGVYSQGKNITFYIPKGNKCVDSFSHELYHVYILSCGVYIGGNLEMTFSGNDILKRIFNSELVGHISNSVEHKLMLFEYLNAGYDRSKFLHDYSYFKAEPALLDKIGAHFLQGGGIFIPAVNLFIGKFFAFVCDPNPDFDYSKALDKLKSIDGGLFQILVDYNKKWDCYDFKKDKTREYSSINQSLYDEMILWSKHKKFTDIS